MKFDEDSLSRDLIFNNEVSEVRSHLLQGNQPGIHLLHPGGDFIKLGRGKGLVTPDLFDPILNELHLRSQSNFQSQVGVVQFSLKGTTSALAK